MFSQNQICHERKTKKSSPKIASLKKPHLSSMSLLAKFEELQEGADLARTQLLLKSIHQDISRIKDPENLISNCNLFSAFKFCHQHQGSLPFDCWHSCEGKILEFISDERFSGFFSSQNKRSKILLYFSSPEIKKTIRSFTISSKIKH
jgi:hypothetical protein